MLTLHNHRLIITSIHTIMKTYIHQALTVPKPLGS